jgi:hypothetical protein
VTLRLIRRVALVVALSSLAATFAGSVTADAAFVNPGHNVAGPALADGTGQCTSTNGGAFECPSPCYPKPRERADHTFVLGLADTRACTQYVVNAMNKVQASEHVHALVLPTNYYQLNVVEQLFVLVNLERITHHVAPLGGLVASLDRVATVGARRAQDPFATGVSFTSIWAGGESTPADAMFGWMYDDGWGGSTAMTSNFACTSATSTGCWGHRDNILGAGLGRRCISCVAGAGFTTSTREHAWPTSYAMIFEDGAGAATVFTWNHNVVPYLTVAYERVRAG